MLNTISFNEKKIRRAFTLIELLVVIAIIGLLATIAVTALVPARQSAHDAKRIADINQIKKALSLFYDANGYYPPSPCGYDCNGYWSSYDAAWRTSAFATALSPYISNLPLDPINSSCQSWTADTCFSISYGNVGRYTNPITYDIFTRLENPSSPYRCGVKNWKWGLGLYGTSQLLCTAFGGTYSNQLYIGGPNE